MNEQENDTPIYQTRDPMLGNLHLVVVAKFDSGMQMQARERVEAIFEQHNVELHSLDDLGQLVSEIRTAAVEHGIIQ